MEGKGNKLTNTMAKDDKIKIFPLHAFRATWYRTE